MKTNRLLLLTLLLAAPAILIAENWPSWRGPNGNNTLDDGNYPLKWSAKENIHWKVELPDRGNSSPIVWGDKVIITQAIEKDHRRTVMAFNRKNGERLWQNGTVYNKDEETHQSNPYCSASPVTDGERIVAAFGSAGVFCYDMNGKELWSRDLGPQSHTWGNASSPVLYQDLCIVYHGPGEGSFMIALNKTTGETVWRKNDPPLITQDRTDGFKGQEPGISGSFSTPMIIQVDGEDQLVMSYHNQLIGRNPKTGEKIWWADGLNPLVYTSTVGGNGVVVAQGGYYGTTLAVQPKGKGDITEKGMLWKIERDNGGIGSGVIKDDRFYYYNRFLICQNLKTGKEHWRERIEDFGPAPSWSSMTLINGEHIYVLNQSGATLVIKAAKDMNIVSINPLEGETTNSTHAFSNGDIFIRTHKHLWCVSEKTGVL